MNISRNSSLIKQEAIRLGFDFCGVSKAGFLEDEAPRFERWLKKNMNGEMKYMEHYFDKRLNPQLLVEGAKSMVSLMLNYFPAEEQKDESAPKISKFAYGNDYHLIIKKKLKALVHFISENFDGVHTGSYVDSAPVMEKVWAVKSGLGWIGKNSNLICKGSGSFFFLAEVIADIELEYDHPVRDYCGTCTACMDACPTGAISSPYVVDGSKCISYFTIELKNAIPEEMKGKFENRAFGCDICQDVCPWNRFSRPHREPLFQPGNKMLEMSQKDWQELTENDFKKMFVNSPLKRTKYSGLKRNIEFIK